MDFEIRHCARCAQVIPNSRPRNVKYCASSCKATAKYLRERTSESRDRARSNYKLRHRVRMMVARAKVRADHFGVLFDLTEDDVQVPAICPVLGIPLSHRVGKGPHRGSPSLDRIKPELGYIKTNVRVISNRANVLKNNATIAELQAVLRDLEVIHGS